MRPMRCARGMLAAITLAAAAFIMPNPAANGQATSAAPSADQMEIFRNLSPDQQDAILRQLGIGGNSQGSSATGGPGRQGTQSNDRQMQQQNEEERLAPRREAEEEERESAIPVMNRDDWLIVEIDFHLQPRPLNSALQAYLLTQGSAASLGVQGLAGGVGGTAPLGANAAAALQAQTQTQNQNQAGNQPLQPISDAEKRQLNDMMDLIRLHNPYRLSHDGVLTLPGFPGVPLLGLTEDLASLRLQSEIAFRKVEIRVTRLPLKKTGAEGLRAFGYDLFNHSPSTFAPVTNVPVPSDYSLGPGDQLLVQLYGNQNRTVPLTVQRDGVVNFPEIGPIHVSGQLFSVVKSSIEARVARQMTGVQASVSMGDTRSIRVFVLGEVRQPASYTVSGLGTITSALYAAGGVKTIGSLRHIQLKRQGVVVRTLDLYDMLIRGDTQDDSKLLPGDSIFVPPVGATVSVDGEVRRPAIYEITDGATVAEAIGLAGGLTSQADRISATITRIDDAQRRIVLPVDMSTQGGRIALRNGDVVRLNRLRPTLDSGIQVQGHVYTQGAVAYRDGMRLTDVIHSVDELQPNADIHYLLIRRETPPDRRISVVSADLDAALRAPGSAVDVTLMPHDRITVFDLSSGRDRIIRDLMIDLSIQGTAGTPSSVVRVDGRVKVPGEYPLETNMTVADLVRAGGGLADEAYGATAELTRYQVSQDGVRTTQLIQIDLAGALQGRPNANVALQAFDFLSVKEVPEWNSQESVTLRGEVRFPGKYSIRRGETLTSVIGRAGGLTDYAFPEGSVFSREELRRREQEQMDMLAARMQRDLSLLALQATAANQSGGAAALSVGQALLSQLRGEKAVGRLVIDLPRAMRSSRGSPADVILRNGDELIVPRFQQEVTVIGEVQNATSHLFSPGFGRDDYISLSGGTTNRADRSKIYVVRANGSVVASSGSRWFQVGSREQIKPGDTVVVPLDAERMPALPFWQAVTGIVYNVAIAAAAVHSF